MYLLISGPNSSKPGWNSNSSDLQNVCQDLDMRARFTILAIFSAPNHLNELIVAAGIQLNR